MNHLMEADLEKLVVTDPGDPRFADLADMYRRRGDYQGAFDLCFNGLTANPSSVRGRVVLARLFYERHQFPFAVRELRELVKLIPDNMFLSKLLENLSRYETMPTHSFSETLIVDEQSTSELFAEIQMSPNEISSLDLFQKDS
jgi:lipopolysaccharide biosynthesis regulator YciM